MHSLHRQGDAKWGIDDMSIYASALAIDSPVIAQKRGIKEKSQRDVGFACRSVIPPFEDPVSLAVNAAKPLVDNLTEDEKAQIELLIVATESGLDFGKPISSFVHRFLGLGPHCRNFEVKHACYGGTAALQMALSWLRGSAEGKRALVICTDVARPHFTELSELSAGSGAIALSLSAHPRVFEVNPISGYGCKEVYDVARPTFTFEWGDPVLSLYSYLDLLETSYQYYCKNSQILGPQLEKFSHILYHAPLVSLLKKAHATLLELEYPDISAQAAEESFVKKVMPSLIYNYQLSNIYSGSLYVSLAGLVASQPDLAAGDLIGCFSYGSGSCAEFYSGYVQKGASKILQRYGLDQHLSQRQKIDVDQYEACMHAYERGLGAMNFSPDLNILGGLFEAQYAGKQRLYLNEVKNYRRAYLWS